MGLTADPESPQPAARSELPLGGITVGVINQQLSLQQPAAGRRQTDRFCSVHSVCSVQSVHGSTLNQSRCPFMRLSLAAAHAQRFGQCQSHTPGSCCCSGGTLQLSFLLARNSWLYPLFVCFWSALDFLRPSVRLLVCLLHFLAFLSLAVLAIFLDPPHLAGKLLLTELSQPSIYANASDNSATNIA